MQTWTAPLIMGTTGITGSLILGEPAAALIWAGIALLGYAINKKAN